MKLTRRRIRKKTSRVKRQKLGRKTKNRRKSFRRKRTKGRRRRRKSRGGSEGKPTDVAFDLGLTKEEEEEIRQKRIALHDMMNNPPEPNEYRGDDPRE